MQQEKKEIIEKRIYKTIENLEKNNMQGIYCPDRESVVTAVRSLLWDGAAVASGGSKTLEEAGVLELLKSGNYHYLERGASLAGPDGKPIDAYRAAFFADTYLCSANAVTENGELYNVDGNSNRTAAILYGPESVIIVAGYNKIVASVAAAANRVKRIAAPANCIRLNCTTFCREHGYCISLGCSDPEIPAGCSSDRRICCNYVISARQRIKNRIKVLLVGESLGY